MNRMLSAAALAAFALCGTLALQPASAACAPGAGPMGGEATSARREAMKADMERHHEEMTRERLSHLADRLEIKASQQGPWQKFTAAFTDVAHAMEPPHMAGHDAAGAGPDAATIARSHAEHAARHAQALARLADATAELQAALGPDQRKVLDEVAQQYARRHLGHGEGEGMHMEMHRAMHGGMHDSDEDHCEGPGRDGHGEGHGEGHERHDDMKH